MDAPTDNVGYDTKVHRDPQEASMQRQEIRDAVSAELDPVPVDDVIAHLEMLERADVVRFQQ